MKGYGLLVAALMLASFHSLAAQTWTAKSNWVSDLPKEQLQKMLGNKEEVKNNLDYSDAYSKSYTYESVDWRNKDGVNWLGKVMNQGNCGSCVAFATIATLEAQVSISRGITWLRPQFSPEALFACGGGACNRGWFPSSAVSYVKRKGVIDNACAPYTMGSTGKDVSCKQFCNNQAERTFTIADSYRPTGILSSGSVQKVKEALKKGPLITSMTVYEDFVTYSSGIYKSTSSKSVGGHAVSIVGYNDAERYWIVRNSWGENWGENGFIRISWDDKSGIGSSTLGFEIAPETNSVAITSPEENDYVSGEMKITTQSTNNDSYAVNILKDGKIHQTITGSKKSLNTLGMEDGKYELVAVSEKDSKVKSMVRGFTVSNTKPQMSLSFQSADRTDLTKPVKGRLEFDVTVESSPIQLQKIDFMVTKLDGTLVTSRTTDVVLNKMSIGFRFNGIPNGDYLIFFRGYLPASGKMNTVDSEKIKITNNN